MARIGKDGRIIPNKLEEEQLFADCKGLCPKCGKDLNEGKCNCQTKEIDPRLEVLKKFLQNNDDNN